MRETPYWREAAPPEPVVETPPPRAVDALVIGAGFTGLGAARSLARAGMDTLVIDAGALGDGASGRNGGMIGWGHRAKLGALSRRYGEAAALEILAEARRSYEHTRRLIDAEAIDCGFRETGRFLAAASPKHFKALVADVDGLSRALGFEAHVVSPGEQSREIVTDAYDGGVLFPSHGGLHPGKLHAGLLAAARRAGARVIGGMAARAVRGGAGGWRVETSSGPIAARELAIATNGYTARPLGWLGRRLLPLPSYIIATEPLGANRIGSLMPGGRMYVDTRSTHSYFRADPSGGRILWGGRASLRALPMVEAARRLRTHMASIFPDLRDVAITHAWTGRIAYTRDVIPHVGAVPSGPLAGAHYAAGYCGSGVAMAPYLGWRMAQKMLRTPEAVGPLDAARFDPFIARAARPAALALTEAWHKWLDARDGVRPIR